MSAAATACQGVHRPSTDLVICFERDAPFEGGTALVVSRFIQQLEPTWLSVWGHKAEERHIRKVQLSSREADISELGIYLHSRVLSMVLLW